MVHRLEMPQESLVGRIFHVLCLENMLSDCCAIAVRYFCANSYFYPDTTKYVGKQAPFDFIYLLGKMERLRTV
jgi:hypothetical protein